MLASWDQAGGAAKAMADFKGKTVVITGATGGVGRDIALDLGRGGANVVVNFATAGEKASRIVESIEGSGGRAIACRADVSRSADVERLTAAALSAFGKIDVLVNSAGINIDRPFLELGEDDWDRVIAVNLKGAFLCTQAVGRVMHVARSGHIVNISAGTALVARKGAANYCASKAGVNMLTQCAALELAPHVRVNCLALGFFRSEAVERLFSEKQVADVVDATPMQRMGEFEEITSAVKFLASDASSFITGQTIAIDGGRVMR